MFIKSFFTVATLIATVSAASITETAMNIIPNHQCKDACSQWLSTVGDCIGNLNATFSASVSTNDLSSWNFQGDASGFPGCLCSAEAVQASQSCLACGSQHLCISPALTMQDYSQVCQSPLPSLWSIFSRYHSSMASCIENGGSQTETSAPPTETETSAPPTETETSAPPTETETSAPPTETETSAPPTETETSAPPTETETSSAPTETETSSSEPCTVTVTPTPLSARPRLPWRYSHGHH